MTLLVAYKQGAPGVTYCKCTDEKYHEESDLILHRQSYSKQEGQWYAEDYQVTGDVETCIGDEMIRGGGALRY